MVKWSLYMLGIAMVVASSAIALSYPFDIAAIGALVLSLSAIVTVSASRARRRFRSSILLVWLVVTPVSLIAAVWGPGELIARTLLAASTVLGLLAAIWSINRRRRRPMMEGYVSY